MFSEGAKEILQIMGYFGPTNNINAKEVKGHFIDDDGNSYKIYINSSKLREYSVGLNEVADWLDKRTEDAS